MSAELPLVPAIELEMVRVGALTGMEANDT